MSDDGEIFNQREWEYVTKELALPPRQMEIVRLLLDGLGDKQIASRLRIALPTVRTHMGRLFAKVGAQDRGEVVVRMFRESRRLCATVKCPLRV
jgi:DNA-binding NarL/FixJ family response regulator